MKCPLLGLDEQNRKWAHKATFTDCIYKECAWWLPEAERCAITQMAFSLIDIKKANEPGYRNLVKLAMKYKVRTIGLHTLECLVCGWKGESARAHIEQHILRGDITEESLIPA